MPYTILLAFLLLAGPSMGPDLPVDKIIEDNMSTLLDFYKEVHMNPEISLKEEQTSRKLAGELQKLGFEVTENVGGYGVVGILRNGQGPQILYRTDMDALPMYEKTNLPYSSQSITEYNGEKVGTMHSCGHDMHMTTWLGTAKAMVEMKDQWTGTLMMIGQPAEEIGKGAKLMLDAGLYERFGVPDYGLALHCSPTIPAGSIGLKEGYVLANTESVDIKIYGVGSHGAAPHMSIDPIVIASMIVMDIQTIVSRNLKPTDPAVITVGAIKGGTKHNIIPDEVHLQLTIRTYTEEVRLLIHRRLKEISEGVARAAGMPEDRLPEITVDGFTPANYNDPNLTQRIYNSANSAIGEMKIMDVEAQMVGEDFSQYGNTKENVPTVIYWLGSVPDERMKSGDLPGLHSPFYYPDPELTLSTGIKVTTQALIDLFKD